MLDPRVIAQLRELERATGEALLEELGALFVEQGPARLRRLRAALAARDAKELEHEAHALKGSAGALGATGLAKLCADLEEGARSGELNGAGKLLRRIEKEVAAADAALSEARRH